MKSWTEMVKEESERLQLAENEEREQRILADRLALNPAAVKQASERSASLGVSLEHVQAQTVAALLDELERFNRLIVGSEWKRDAVVREIDRRRHARFAQKAREELLKISAEEEVISDLAAQPAGKKAA